MPGDDQLVLDAAHEMIDRAPIELVLSPPTAFSLAAVWQLAMRHPHFGGEPQRVAIALLEILRAAFADAPAISEMLRRGDDPEHDA